MAPPNLHELLAFEQRAHDCRVCLLVIEDDLVEEAVTRATAALDCDGHGDALRNAVGREQVACSLDLGKLRHVGAAARTRASLALGRPHEYR